MKSDIVDHRTLPREEELYEGGLRRMPWDWFYAHTIEPAKEWAADHRIAAAAVTIAAAGVITASVILPNALGKNAQPASQTITQPNTQPAIVIDASSVYRSQVRDALLQDVPELANYRSALDYTTQRVVDMKNVYGLSLDQVRSPVTKWVGANIEWERKGERLVPFTEEVDYIPDTLFRQNATADPETDKKTIAIDQTTLPMGDKWLQKFTLNTETVINEHDATWKEVHDPEIVDNYLDLLGKYAAVLYHEVQVSFPPYVKAIREKGTFADKAHWALYTKGRDVAPDEIRQHVGLSYILSVGGKAQIETWGFQARTEKPYSPQHGDLAVVMSPQLKQYLESDPSKFGHLLDPEYLSILPSREGAETQGTLGTNKDWKIAAIWREQPSRQLGVPSRKFIYGDEATAVANGHR